MRNFRSIVLCITAALAAGCENSSTELLLVKPSSPIDSEIVQDIVNLLGDDAEVSIFQQYALSPRDIDGDAPVPDSTAYRAYRRPGI